MERLLRGVGALVESCKVARVVFLDATEVPWEGI